MEGTGFVHSGGDIDAGTIQTIGIDVDNNSVADDITDDEIRITGLSLTAGADPGCIGNGAFDLFGTALQGDDFFDLSREREAGWPVS